MYDHKVVRELFEKWGKEEPAGDPGESLSRWTVPHVNHVILDRWLPSQGNALDAGCGLGIESVRTARHGLDVTAVDISASLLQHAQKRAKRAGLFDRITFVQADVTEPLPVRQDHFDACIAVAGVVGHAGDRHQDAIANLVACARPGGLVIIGVASYYGKIREYLSIGRIDEAERVADTGFTHTVSDTFEDYCFKPQELVDLLDGLRCSTLAMLTVPPVGPYGYDIEAPDEIIRRRLALEERFLAIPELLGAGDQLVGVFERRT